MALGKKLMFLAGFAFLAAFPLHAKADQKADCNNPYQIVKATADTLWRLNTKTGAISACRFVEGVMECASEQTAVVRYKSDYKSYRDEQRQQEKQEREEELAFMERIFEMGMKFIRSFIELEKETAQ